ncbi:hypothetical protein ACP70R_005928 [Stipagrostis hirtigluma subsp. patula]
MEWSRSCCIAVLLLLLPRLCSPAGDQLAPGEALLPGQTIVSDGGAFALGFFSPSNSTPARQYVGIWYNNIPVRTVVWVANREVPAIADEPSGNSSSASTPSLALASDTSNLVLSGADGRAVWTTNVTATASSPSNGSTTTAVLLNTGNLVLRSPNGTTLWQSFDHLSDTFIPGTKIGLRYRTHDGGRIVSWRGPGDPSPGSFSYGMDPDTSLQMLVWNGTRPYWRSGVWTGYMTISRYHATTGTVIYVAVVDGEDEIYTTFSVSDGAPPTRYVVTDAGRFQLQSWNRNASAWTVLESWPSTACSPYGSCGAYGYCDVTAAAGATCRCPDGFEPASREEWTGGVFSRGCRRTQALAPCGGGGGEDGFLALPYMKVPDKFVLVGSINSDAECAAECRRNCTCVAYAFASLRSSSAKGNIARCLVWTAPLVDAQMIGERWGVTAETLYLRVPAGSIGSGGGARKNVVRIVLPVLAGVLVLVSIFLLWCCKSRGNKRSNESEKKLVPASVRTSSELGEEDPTQDLELPTIQFSDIVAATKNFSRTCMIGRGGFGKVYNYYSAIRKATLVGGREVAVKRLSKDSEQGIEEFKNEAILISKLQHRNLVRLLGCCTEGAERLLIYEYLANKGLDAILFDSERKSLLDWQTRFGIIKGVARGLLYLHQDSRLTVIHRDLKASNVLLDAEMRPKIADFGMAKIFGENQQKANTKRVVGTYGYIAPEYQIEGVFSIKSDVYSFGVLLLEIVSGVKISSTDDIMGSPGLVAYAWKLWKEGNAYDLVDSSVAESCARDEALLCIHVGLLCVQDDPSSRPLMASVVSILENGSVSLPAPDQPAYFAERSCEADRKGDDPQNSRNSLTLTALQGR